MIGLALAAVTVAAAVWMWTRWVRALSSDGAMTVWHEAFALIFD